MPYHLQGCRDDDISGEEAKKVPTFAGHLNLV